MNYFSISKTAQSMASQTFVNKKLDFVEELVQYTDSHIFLTGKAGTGKTTFLRNLQLKKAKRMVVVAPTGVAAINAGGQTIHSFFQLPFGPQLPEDVQNENIANPKSLAAQFQKIRKNKLKLMRSLELLVIDEISMVRADVIDAIDSVLRRARHSQKPFGGVQLLMIGDVHQLAPVAKQEEWEILAPYYNTVYFFGSHVLQKTSYICVELEHIYRQHDMDFISILNKVRNNKLDADCLNVLNARFKPNFNPKDDEGYITLTTHNYQADEINDTKLAALKEKTLHFTAEVKGQFPENTYPTKEDLELKIGAQVMFVKNDPNPEKAYFNGKIGTLVSYDEKEKTLCVKSGSEHITVSRVKWQNFEYSINPENNEIEEKEIGSFEQIPLRLAWAITIHKSQGLTFDKLIVDAGQAFAHGQVYVALSRCTSLEGLVLKTRISPNALVSDYSVDNFVNKMPELEPTQEKVDGLRHEYELSCMLDLIDFMGLYQDFGKLNKVIITNDTLFESKMIQDLSHRRTQIHEELCEVSFKFEAQIRKLHAEIPSCEQNPTLQERLKKGVVYFSEHLKAIAKGLLELPFKTDNKAVNEQIKEALNQLKEDIFVKDSCLEACKDGFSVKAYQETKLNKVLDAEKKEKENVVIHEGMMEDNDLYTALARWRRSLGEELGLPLYAIASNKTLKSIAQLQPVTLRDLKNAEGMGSKRVKLYGAEIIDIVLKQTGLLPVEEEPEPELKPKKEAKPKPEPKPKKEPKPNTYELTRQLLEQGLTLEEIAKERGFALTTIEGHVAHFIKDGEYKATDFVDKEKYDEIVDYFESTGDKSLSIAKDVLGDDFSFGEIKMVLAELEKERFFENLPQDDED